MITRGWIPASLISFLATKAVPSSFQKLNKMLSTLSPTSESKFIKDIDTKGAYQYVPGAVDHIEAADAGVQVVTKAAPSHTGVIAKIHTAPVIKRQRSILETIRYILEVLTPWMVAFLFGKTVFDLFKLYLHKRRKASGV